MSRELYGGAITFNVPSRFADVSRFRDIPDHQEVLVDADTDQSKSKLILFHIQLR